MAGIRGLLGLNAALELRAKHQVHGCWGTHPVRIADIDAWYDR